MSHIRRVRLKNLAACLELSTDNRYDELVVRGKGGKLEGPLVSDKELSNVGLCGVIGRAARVKNERRRGIS